MVDRQGFSHFYNLKEMNLWWQNLRLTSKEWESQFWDIIYRRDFTYLFIDNRYSFLLLLSANHLEREQERKQLIGYQFLLINIDSFSLKVVTFWVLIWSALGIVIIFYIPIIHYQNTQEDLPVEMCVCMRVQVCVLGMWQMERMGLSL